MDKALRDRMMIDRSERGARTTFDRSGLVRRPPYSALLREMWSLAAYHPPAPDVAGLALGHGQIVLVIPAFLTGDAATRPLRAFLESCGYRSYGWNNGVNWGPRPELMRNLPHRLAELRALQGGPISIVGVSLGGVYARELAYDCATDLRKVITLVSPFRLPTASTIEPLFRLCSLSHEKDIDFSRLSRPLPVPSAAIFTRDDGIVAWESCFSSDHDCVAIEVSGAHVTICRNPAALRAVVEQLADTDPAR